MRQSTDKLAAGRLGPTFPAAEGARPPSEYGTRRLGLRSAPDPDEAEGPAPDADVPVEQPVDAPAAAAAAPDAPPAPSDTAGPAGGPPMGGAGDDPPDEPVRLEPYYVDDASPGSDAPPDRPGGRRALAAVIAGASAVLLLLACLWSFGGGEAPAPASADVAGAGGAPARPPGRPAPRAAEAAGPAAAAPRADRSSPRPKAREKAIVERPWLPDPTPPGPLPALRPASAPVRLHRPRPPRPTEASAPPPESPADRPAPPPAAPDAPPDIALSCIMRTPDGRVAIINGRCVGLGKTVRGARIVSIGEFSIQIEHGGRRYTVGIATPTPRAAAEPASAPADSPDSPGPETPSEKDTPDESP